MSLKPETYLHSYLMKMYLLAHITCERSPPTANRQLKWEKGGGIELQVVGMLHVISI